ncbi:MAG TPA: hypothetical protein VKZ84_04755 [Bacteriovoracaceae bacterium]|nr:hypothetical protein [Bacteriovoracaceae bacterium]
MGNQRRVSIRFNSLRKLINSEKGLSLIEVITGFAIAGSGAFLILNGLDFLERRKSSMDKSANQEAIVSGLVESIRSNIAMEKIDFNPKPFLEAREIEELLPFLKLCWLDGGTVPLEEFPNCQGKLGYVVYPLKIGNLEYRGMYKVTIKITHETLIPGQFKQYDFIVKD